MDIRESAEEVYHEDNRHPWELARFDCINDLLKKKFTRLNEKSFTIFDIGCGDTFFIESFSKKHPYADCYAIDNGFNEEEILKLKNKFKNTRIFPHISIESAFSKLTKEIDFVLLLDVIEHIEDDFQFLSELKQNKFISENTVFIITVPAFQCLFTKHDKFLKHYRRYEINTLLKKLSKSGYIEISSGYFFHILLIPRIVKKFVEMLFKYKTTEEKGIGRWKGTKILTKMLKKILYFDFKVCFSLLTFKIKLPGLSIFTICKKHV